MTQDKNTEERVDNPEFLRHLVQTYLQEYLEEDMVRFLEAFPYERTKNRKGYRNRYIPRQLNTRVGKLFLSVNLTRDGSFSTELFERCQRSGRALLSCLPACRRPGRKWSSRVWPPERCTCPPSRGGSRRGRSHIPPGREESHTVLIAVGINSHGKRDILGVDVCSKESLQDNTENETNWSDFFNNLVERGLRGVRFVISDAHTGLVSAVERYFPGCQWQRCQVHFKKNIMDKVRNKHEPWIKERLDDIFSEPDKQAAFHRLQKLTEDLSDPYPGAAELLETGGEDTLTCMNFPAQHRRRLWTSRPVGTGTVEPGDQETNLDSPNLSAPGCSLTSDRCLVYGAGRRMGYCETVPGHVVG